MNSSNTIQESLVGELWQLNTKYLVCEQWQWKNNLILFEQNNQSQTSIMSLLQL